MDNRLREKGQPIINPYIAITMAVVAVSSASIFIRLIEASSLVISLYRMGLAFLLITPVTLLKHREELKTLTKKDLCVSLVSGVFLAFHFYTWISSLNYTTVASSVLLVDTHSIFVLVGSYLLFREKVPDKALVGAALALSGSIFISVSDFRLDSQVFLGDVLALSGAFFVAGYFLIGRDVRQRLSILPYTFLVYGSCTFTLLIIGIATSTTLGPGSIKNVILFFALAIIPTLLGHSVFNWGLEYVQASVVSVAMLGEPVGATILAILVLHELPTYIQVIGGIVIITGLYIFTVTTEKS